MLKQLMRYFRKEIEIKILLLDGRLGKHMIREKNLITESKVIGI